MISFNYDEGFDFEERPNLKHLFKFLLLDLAVFLDNIVCSLYTFMYVQEIFVLYGINMKFS